eukprot:TRINITY_DN16040_c0_g1_i1.p1 TRINITY_DN16040_c0_g1~~TRINITY_DN16040_c0_g1_i1.p1  ORF type:complete len:582 (+),score=101.62 TRINITY_DN16040_c0_g1_i1:60-1805(+)
MSGKAARDKERKERLEREQKRHGERLNGIVQRWWKGRKIVESVWLELLSKVDMKKVVFGQGMDLNGFQVLQLCIIYKRLHYDRRLDKSDTLMKIINCSIQKQASNSLLHYHTNNENWTHTVTHAFRGILTALLDKSKKPTEIDFTMSMCTKLFSVIPWKNASVTPNRVYLNSLAYEVILVASDVAAVSEIICKAAVFAAIYKPAVFLTELLARPPGELALLKQHVVTAKMTFTHPFWLKLLSCTAELTQGSDEDDSEVFIGPEVSIFVVCSLYNLAVATAVMTRLTAGKKEESEQKDTFPDGFYSILNVFLSRFPPRSVLNSIFTEYPDVEKTLLEMRGNPKVNSKYDLFYAKTLEENPPPLSKAERRRRQRKRRELRDRQKAKEREEAKEAEKQAQKKQKEASKQEEDLRKQRMVQFQEFWSVAHEERESIAQQEQTEYKKINDEASSLKAETSRLRKAEADRRMQRLYCMESEYKKRMKIIAHQEAVLDSVVAAHLKRVHQINRSRSKLHRIEPDEASTRRLIIDSQAEAAEQLFLQQQLAFRRMIIVSEMQTRSSLLTDITETYFWIPFSLLLLKKVK